MATATAREGVASLEVLGAPPFDLYVARREADGDGMLEPSQTRLLVPTLPPDGVVLAWLPHADQLVGQVLGDAEPETWRPVEGVRVEYEQPGDPSLDVPPSVGHTTTNPQGLFAVDARRGGGEVRLRAVPPPGWVVVEEAVYARRRQSEWHGTLLRLHRTGRLEGRLRVAGDAPMPERSGSAPWPAFVRVARSHDLDPGYAGAKAEVGPDGRWAFDEVPRFLDLQVSVDDDTATGAGFLPPEPRSPVRADGPPVEIDLVPGTTRRGRVLATDGTPRGLEANDRLLVVSADGSEVPHSLRSDSDGRFEIIGLPRVPVAVVWESTIAAVGDTQIRGRWIVERWVAPGAADLDLVAPPLGGVSIRLDPARSTTIIYVGAYEAGTPTLRGWYHVDNRDGVVRIEGLPADRALVLSFLDDDMNGPHPRVATCGPLRAGESATVAMGPPAVFHVEDAACRARYGAALGRLYAIAPGATWPLWGGQFHPALGDEKPQWVGPPPGRYDLVERREDGSTVVLARDVEARVPVPAPKDPLAEDDGDDP